MKRILLSLFTLFIITFSTAQTPQLTVLKKGYLSTITQPANSPFTPTYTPPYSGANQGQDLIKRNIEIELRAPDDFVSPSGSWSASLNITAGTNSTTLELGNALNRTKHLMQFPYSASAISFSSANTSGVSTDFEVIIRVVEVVAKNGLDNSSNPIIPVDVNSKCIADNGSVCERVELSWEVAANQFFEQYQLQIAKVEPGFTSNGNGGYNLALIYDWDGASSIIVDGTIYDFTPRQGSGYYIWRVKGVGNKESGENDYMNYADWSTASTNSQINSFLSSSPFSVAPPPAPPVISDNPYRVNASVSSMNNNNIYSAARKDVFYYEQADEDVNWKYQGTFLEGGRKGEVIQYANGLNQVLQTQSRIASINTVVGLETAYDYLGRPVVSSMPSPLEQPYISYNEPVLKPLGNPAKAYAAEHFDDPSNPYNATALDPASTVLEYYSSTNNKDRLDQYIPVTQAAYSRMLYLPDPSGRVMREAGIGEGFELSQSQDPNENHNVTRQYATPTQTELDRIFGNEAPEASSAYKIAVTDPNGVRTIEYYSKNGNKLASFLDNDVTLDNLLGVGGNRRFTIEDVLPATANQGKENYTSKNIIVSGNRNINLGGGTILERVTPVNLNYEMSPASFGVSCDPSCTTCDFCYSCAYRVDISIHSIEYPNDTDRNAILSFLVGPFANCASIPNYTSFADIAAAAAAGDIRTVDYSASNWLFDPAGNPSTSNYFSNIANLTSVVANPSVFLETGTYTIERKLSVYDLDTDTNNILVEAIDDLRNRFANMTKDDNCCGPFVPDTFSCDTEFSVNCGDPGELNTQLDDLSQLIVDLAAKEQNHALSNGNPYVQYLQIPNADLLSHQYLPGVDMATIRDWLQVLLCERGMPINDLVACIMGMDGFLDGNIQRMELVITGQAGNATGSSTPPSQANEHLDIMTMLFQCIGSDPFGHTCADYRVAVQNDPSNTPTQEEDDAWAAAEADPFYRIVVYYDEQTGYDISTLQSSYNVSLNQLMLVPYMPINSSQNPNLYSQAAIENGWCVQNASVMASGPATSGLTQTEIDEQIANYICSCISNNQNQNPSSGGGGVQIAGPNTAGASQIDLMIEACEEGCKEKRLAFEVSVNNLLQELNMAQNPPAFSPSDPNWNENLLSDNDKECMMENLYLSCLKGCQLGITRKFKEMEDNNCAGPNCSGSCTAVDFCPYIDPAACPGCSAVYGCITDAVSDPCITDQLVREQQEFEESYLYTPSVKQAISNGYAQAGTKTEIQDEIIAFIYDSWDEILAEPFRTANQDELQNYPNGVDNVYNPELHNNPTPGYNPDFLFVQKRQDYLYDLSPVNPAFYGEIEVAVSVIFDPGMDPQDPEDDIIRELNFALYCYDPNEDPSDTWNKSPFMAWAVSPDIISAICPLFQGINYAGYNTRQTIADLYFDAYENLHAEPFPAQCNPALVTTDYYYHNVSDIPYMLSTDVTVSGGSAGQDLLLEIAMENTQAVAPFTYYTNNSYIMNQSASFSTAVTTASDAASEINITASTPNFYAQAAGNTITIYVKADRNTQFTDDTWRLFVSGSVSTLMGNNGYFTQTNQGMSLPDLIDQEGCTTIQEDNLPTGDCPYGYDLVSSASQYTGLDLTANPNDLNRIGNWFENTAGELVKYRKQSQLLSECTDEGLEIDMVQYYDEKDFVINGSYYTASVEVIGAVVNTVVSGIETFDYSDIHYMRFKLVCKSSGATVIDYSFGDTSCGLANTFPVKDLVLMANGSGVFPANMPGNGSAYLFNNISLVQVSANEHYLFFDFNNTNIRVSYANGVNPGTGNGVAWQTNTFNTGTNPPTKNGTVRATTFQPLTDLVLNRNVCNPPLQPTCDYCEKWSLPEVEEPDVPEADILTCEDELSEYIQNQISSYLDLCFESKKKELIASYENDCIANFSDQLGFSYRVNFDGYTLYYYDRAGNLIRTVSPEGVEVLNQTEMADANAYRQSGIGSPEWLEHRIATDYRYNSLGQLMWQNTPDGGTTEFLYNYNQQLILSQNARQQPQNRASYTIYDYLGRIIETGELSFANPGVLSSYQSTVNANPFFPYTSSALTTLLGDVSQVTDRTKIFYSTSNLQTAADPASAVVVDFENVRNRIWKTESYDASTSDVVRTFYSYDVHGNVKTLVQEVPPLGWRTVEYEYDLLSGNVNLVKINTVNGLSDESFFHRYYYDEDNRIVKVETSLDGEVWDEDANYEYYAHGPLARTRLGEYQVQGIDHTYTLQGWLKSLNHPIFEKNATQNDPGNDGAYVMKATVELPVSGVTRTINGLDVLNVYSSTTTNLLGITTYNLTTDDPVEVATAIVHAINTAGADFRADNRGGTSEEIVIYAHDPVRYQPSPSHLSGVALNTNGVFSRTYSPALDEYAMELGYYNGDYIRSGTNIGGYVDPNGLPTAAADQLPRFNTGTSPWTDNTDNLRNGNIRYWTSNTRSGEGASASFPMSTRLHKYKYDYWNRLRSANTEEYDPASGSDSRYVPKAFFNSEYTYDLNGNLKNLIRYDQNQQEVDKLTYVYNLTSSQRFDNRLVEVSDGATASGSNDLPLNYLSEYVYDELGNLVQDSEEDLDIQWTPYGKISSVTFGAGSSAPGQVIRFRYDAMGNRVRKTVTQGAAEKITIYLRDASGNVMAVYSYDNESDLLQQEEVMLYGSSRLGALKRAVNVCLGNCSFPEGINWNSVGVNYELRANTYSNKQYELTDHLGNVRAAVSDQRLAADGYFYRFYDFENEDINGWVRTVPGTDNSVTNGELNIPTNAAKTYSGQSTGNYYLVFELVAGSANVDLTIGTGGGVNLNAPTPGIYVISAGAIGSFNIDVEFTNTGGSPARIDNIQLIKANNDQVYAEVVNWSDYYPFGMQMPGRIKQGADKYRYGFNGMEKDDEVKGEGNSYTTHYRNYDSRIGRWLSVDPRYKKYPSFSPYSGSGNNPILIIDLDGDTLRLGGSIGAAFLDILSLVPDKYKPLISLEGDKVVIDQTQQRRLLEQNVEPPDDSGFELVLKLIRSDKRYLYEVSEKVVTDKGTFLSGTSPDHVISTTPLSQFYGMRSIGKYGDPSGKADGQVVIHPNITFYEEDENGNLVEKSRSSVVFHALEEIYQRTDKRLPYDYAIPDGKGGFKLDPNKKGAHRIAIDKEERFHGRSRQPGKVAKYKAEDVDGTTYQRGFE